MSNLAASDPQTLCPKLIVQVHLQDGVPVDASLTANSIEFLSKIATNANIPLNRWPSAASTPSTGRKSFDSDTATSIVISELAQESLLAPAEPVAQSAIITSDQKASQPDSTAASPKSQHPDTIDNPHVEPSTEHKSANSTDTSDDETKICDALRATEISGRDKNEGIYEVIEVPLVFDAQFFDMLQNDVSKLDAIQAEEEKNMTSEIVLLGKDVGKVTKPTKFSKSDMSRWRQIFELYLDAEVFFATHEQDHGARSGQVALRQLQWFQNQVEKKKLSKDFKLPESRAAYARFISLNASLLKNLQFQELNKTAVTKILKSELLSKIDQCFVPNLKAVEFDKRTALGVSRTFPNAVHSDRLLAKSIAQDVCAQMSQELVSVVPQLNDYLCPVCFSVAYMPIRLDCQHIFCIRCIIKIQRRRERNCPLCRSDVVLKASSGTLSCLI